MTLDKKQKGAIYFILVALIAIVIYTEYKNDKVADSEAYSIGLVYSYFRGTATGPILDYKYHVDDQVYHGGKYFNENNYDKYENHFFRVKYSIENPSWSDILLDYPITDTVAIKAAGFSLPKKKRNQFQGY